MTRLITLFSSSSGNCTLLENDDTKILIDAGVSMSKITSALSKVHIEPSQIDAVLVTHEHSDHTSGLGIFCKKYTPCIYASLPTLECIKANVIASADTFHSVDAGASFHVGSMTVKAFPTPHDAVSSLGYVIESEGKKFGIATDTGTITKAMLSALATCEAVLIEANHDEDMLKSGPYPYPLKRRILSDKGHLSNDKCAWLATQLAIWGTKKIMLGHMSDHNNTPPLAYNTVKNMLEKNGFVVDRDVILKVAQKDDICVL